MVVDLTIAVVVQLVAILDAWGFCALTRPPFSTDARLLSDHTLADRFVLWAERTGLLFAVFAQAAFIDHTIAVVVDPIADLGGGADLFFASPPRTLAASLDPCDASALTAKTHDILSDGFEYTARCFGITTALLVLLAGLSGASVQSVVDQTVAVVVLFVAELFAGDFFADARTPCIVLFAGLEARTTRADVEGLGVCGVARGRLFGRTVGIAFGVTEIGTPIAIVVDAIQTAFFGVFGKVRADLFGFAIAPQKLRQWGGLGFLLSPFAGSDFLQQLAGADLALALGRIARICDTSLVDAVALKLEIAAITRLCTLEAAGVVLADLDSIRTFGLFASAGHRPTHQQPTQPYHPSKPAGPLFAHLSSSKVLSVVFLLGWRCL